MERQEILERPTNDKGYRFVSETEKGQSSNPLVGAQVVANFSVRERITTATKTTTREGITSDIRNRDKGF